MTGGLDLFTAAAESEARDAAIARVDEHADTGWKARARAAVTQAAESLPALCSDDIWATGLEKPREARALGAVMRWAQARGLIEPTSIFRQSTQAGCHRMDVRIWRSLVYVMRDAAGEPVPIVSRAARVEAAASAVTDLWERHGPAVHGRYRYDLADRLAELRRALEEPSCR